jgi:hypothetical protein
MEIRRMAIVACCQVLAKEIATGSGSSYAMQIASEIIEKILMAGIADTGIMRTCILR